MEFYLIIFMCIATVLVAFFVLKSVFFSKSHYVMLSSAIEAQKKEFIRQYENLGKNKEHKINYTKSDIMTDLISFTILFKNIEPHANKNQKVYLQKLKQLLYIDMIAFLTCFDENYKEIDIKLLKEEKHAKLIFKKIEEEFVKPNVIKYEVHKEIKQGNYRQHHKYKAEHSKMILNIERKIKKQKNELSKIFVFNSIEAIKQ